MEPLDAAVVSLEWSVNRQAAAAGVAVADLNRLAQPLDQLKAYHLPTYLHSLRTGLLASNLALALPDADPALALLGGCGHDIGKLTLLRRTLDAKRLKPGGRDRIQTHARASFQILQTELPEAAIVAGLHHRFQPGGYGLDLNHDAPPWLTPARRQRLEDTAKLVMLADFYDAMTTRDNEKGWLSHLGDQIEQQQLMLGHFPDLQEPIGHLFRQNQE